MNETDIKAGRITQQMTFNEKVWALTARIPKGKVTTYAHLARALDSRAYRAVGNAMNKNPYAPAVPCHRVVGSDGSLTGFAGGLPKKQAMLRAEGVPFVSGRIDRSVVVGAQELRPSPQPPTAAGLRFPEGRGSRILKGISSR